MEGRLGPKAQGGAAAEDAHGDEPRQDATHDLRGGVEAGLGAREAGVAAGEVDGAADGGVEVRAGHVAQGVDHGAQGGGDAQRGRGAAREHVAAHGEHQDEGAQELAEQLLRLLGAGVAKVRWPDLAEEEGGQEGPSKLKECVPEAVPEMVPAGDVQ